MYWGAARAWVLTFLGYLLLATGSAAGVAQSRRFLRLFQDEISVLAAAFSRYTPVGPFYMLREDPVSKPSRPRYPPISRGCRGAGSMALPRFDGRHDALPDGTFSLKILSCLDKP